MARLNCICGHRTRLTGHSEYEFYLLSARSLDKLTEQSNEKPLNGDELNTALLERTHETSCCEECGRIYFDDVENGKLVVQEYFPEKTIRIE